MGEGEPVASTAGSLTTPGPIDLQATLARHGAAAGSPMSPWKRPPTAWTSADCDGLTFAAGVFTNLTRDHLDYHGTMEAYLASKLRLSSLLGLTGIEVVNLDDDAGRPSATRTAAAHLRASPGGRRAGHGPGARCGGIPHFALSGRFGAARVSLPLLGDFNVANALAAAATALASGRSDAEVADAALFTRPRCPAAWSGSATRLHRAAGLCPHPRRAGACIDVAASPHERGD